MPIAPFESKILRLLAANRNPESHVAGAMVLNQAPETPRMSEDIDIFHDSSEALTVSLQQDLATLESGGYQVEVRDLGQHMKRAFVRKDGEATKLEWVHDSAFRYFPVEPDEEMGYRLNYWDAATNKVLAGAGRAEARDYIDLLHLHQTKLSLGALIWAAAGKDDGLSPNFIIEEMGRVQRYKTFQFDKLRLKEPVDLQALKKVFIQAIHEARELCSETLLDAPYGCFFLDDAGTPVTPTATNWESLQPHFGTIRGAWPRIVEEE